MRCLTFVIGNICRRFKAAKILNKTFSVLWKYLTTDNATIAVQAKALCEKYNQDICEDFVDEIQDLKKIHTTNISSENLAPFDLLNMLYQQGLEGIFPNTCILLRIFGPFRSP